MVMSAIAGCKVNSTRRTGPPLNILRGTLGRRRFGQTFLLLDCGLKRIPRGVFCLPTLTFSIKKLPAVLRICVTVLCTLVSLHAQQDNRDLAGIAHTAIRVGNLERSRGFYEALGFQEAFSRKRDGVPTESFFKVNDRQFIELYPRSTPTQAIGFMHICFESDALQVLHDTYVQQGLKPIQVRRAGAGNLLFTMEGPEKQNIEFTQYMPGSMHSEDRGKHLGADRVADRIFAAGIPMKDAAAARDFYESKMAFTGSRPPLRSLRRDHEWLHLSGPSGEMIAFVEKLPAGTFELLLEAGNLQSARAALTVKGLHPQTAGQTITVLDPDGNRIVIVARAR